MPIHGVSLAVCAEREAFTSPVPSAVATCVVVLTTWMDSYHPLQ